MLVLVIGLIIFLGVHSVRIFAEPWRTATRARVGEGRWKGLYSLVAIVGFVLIVWGFGMSRQQPVVLWQTPYWTRHLSALLTLIAFILITAAYVPRNYLKAAVHDPMILGVKVWAVAHLLTNGNLSEVVLFGAFLLWAVADFGAARRRSRLAGIARGNTLDYTVARTIQTLVIGLVAWAAFAFYLHRWLIGVQPIP
ncbi:NnrU family protein [soil metagenome]